MKEEKKKSSETVQNVEQTKITDAYYYSFSAFALFIYTSRGCTCKTHAVPWKGKFKIWLFFEVVSNHVLKFRIVI